MALNFSKLREALEFTRKDHAKPNLTLDVRIELRAIDREDVGGLIWKVSSPTGGYGRNTNQAAGVITMLAVRLADMERAVRREIATGKKEDVAPDLDEGESD
jgi:hypothetical protein